MRAIITLGMMASAKGDCTIDSSSAVAHSIQSTMFIWASTKRCTGDWFEEAGVKCERDVTAAIESVISLANDIAGMVSHCSDIKTKNQKCASLVTDLVGKTAGLAHDGGSLADKCAKIVPKHFNHGVFGKKTTLGMCVANSGAAMSSLFKAGNVIKGAVQHCERKGSDRSCITSSLNVLAVISNLGAYLSASVSNCNSYAEITAHHKNGNVYADSTNCASSVLSTFADLAVVAQIGMKLKDACHVSDARLFIENGSIEVTEPAGMTTNPIVFGLAAMVPITAALSFVAGQRLAKAKQQLYAHTPMTLEAQEGDLSME